MKQCRCVVVGWNDAAEVVDTVEIQPWLRGYRGEDFGRRRH